MVGIAVVVGGALLLLVGAFGLARDWRAWRGDSGNPRVHDLERLVRESGIRRLAALRADVTVTVATAALEAVPEPIVDDTRSKAIRPSPRLARGSEAQFAGVPALSPALPRVEVPARGDATPLPRRPFLPGVHERS
jgi:hypothetical protein